MVKETIMVIKVDFQCCRCYKKIKKILCQFPEIRDQVYDERNNTVTITVVCCSPEKIKQKICCKGGDIIKCIEIKEPPKPKPTEKPTEKETEKPPPKDTEKPKDGEKPKDKPVDGPPAPKAFVPVLIPIGCPTGVCCRECSEGRPGGPCHDRPPPPPVCCEECYNGRPGGPCFRDHCRPASPPANPIGACCQECSEGRTGGPCFRGPCYEGYGRPVYDSWGGGGRVGYYSSRCDYFCEENPSSCTIM